MENKTIKLKIFFLAVFVFGIFGLAQSSQAVYPVAGRKKFIFPAFVSVVFIIFASFLFASPAYGAEYYLNPASGSDNNNGSINSPQKTLDKIAISVAPGDTVYIRGGTYIESQYTTTADGIFQWRTYSPFKTGTVDNPITISAYPGEKVIFNGEGKPYFIFFNSVYNRGYSGHHINIKNLDFINYQGIAIRGGYSDTGGVWPTRNIVIDNCSFKNFSDLDTGAVAFGHSSNFIVKNSYFENIGVKSSTVHPIYIGEDCQNILIEGNTIKGASGFAIHGYGHNDYSTISKNIIIRKNTIINPRSTHIIISATRYEGVYIYGNTLYSTHMPYAPTDNLDTGRGLDFRYNTNQGLKKIRIKNNIDYGPFSDAAFILTNPLAVDDFYMDFNLIKNTNTDAKAFVWGLESNGNYKYYNLEDFRSLTGLCQNCLNSEPIFSDSNNFDLSLKSSSPAIDRGAFLTRTISSGTVQTISVEDVGYFSDGFGMIEGDNVKIGNNTVTIKSIDYASNAITIDRSIAVNNGDAISLLYSGAKPDIGAYEYQTAGDTIPPASPTGLTVL